MRAYFGPAGNSDSFTEQGRRSTAEAPAWLAAMGLDAYEYQAGNGVRISPATALAIKAQAGRNSIKMSLHAPYYISLSGADPEKRLGSIRYILASCEAARNMGAHRVIIHMGGTSGMKRSEALSLAVDTLSLALAECRAAGYHDITLCPEALGRQNQLGEPEELILLCLVDEALIPCADFGHINARSGGALRSPKDYAHIFDLLENALGRERTAGMHIHFSHIEYGPAGEKRHLRFDDRVYGPFFEDCAVVLAERGYHPTVICESRGTQAEDALEMKRIYTKAVNKL